MRAAQFAKQLLLIGLASSLWSAAGEPSLLAFFLAYAAAWIAFELPPVRRWLAAARVAPLLIVAAVLALPGIAFGYRARAELAQREGLFGAGERLRDRLRLDGTPSIAPPLLAADRPQTWFVSAPGASTLEFRADGIRTLVGEALGAGLFRLDYDPRRDGVPSAQTDALEVALIADGDAALRTLQLVRPLAHPRWFCLAPDRSRAAAVSEETDELFVLDARGVTLRTNAGDGPVDCAFVDRAQIALTYRHQQSIEIRDADTGAVHRRLGVGDVQGRLAVSPSGALLAVSLARAELVILRLPELSPVARVKLRAAADWLSFGADDHTLFATTRANAELVRVRGDGASFAEDRALSLGRPVVTLARTRDGTQLSAAVTDVHSTGHRQLGNHFVQDQLLGIDAVTLAITERLRTAERSERQGKPGDVDRGISPIGISAARDGGVWVSFAGSDEIWHVHHDRAEPDRIALDTASLYAPHGVAELADGTLLVSSPVAGAFGVFVPGAKNLRIVRVSPADDALLALDRVALARRVGERGFYEGTRSGIACQSCHMHADSDEAAYNLGDRRLLPTLSVRGLAGTAPYLRDGSYARLRDLDDVAQTLYRGYLRSQAARDETIAAFVGSLPRRENRAARDHSAERRGFAAFRRARCDGCHVPPAFTNLAQVPLRLLFPDQAATLEHEEWLDTPSLLSVAASAPYLNDGRAQTIEAVLVDHNQRNTHGDVRSLSAAERRDLIAFVSSL